MHEALKTCDREKLNFFRIYGGTLMVSSVIFWWRYFGNRNEDSHWTKLIPEENHEEFREQLSNRLSDQPVTDFGELWKQIESMRNRGFAHHDFNEDARPAKYPFLAPLRVTAETLYVWVINELDHYGSSGGLVRPEHILDRRREEIVRHWHKIVQAAREGTAEFLDSPWDFKINCVPISEHG